MYEDRTMKPVESILRSGIGGKTDKDEEGNSN
jgi:hypothetical protein